jgi:hypothetical protein
LASSTPTVGWRVEGVIMPGTRWIKVDATIVECFRAWGEPWTAAHPRFEIVVDIERPGAGVERVTAQQKLSSRTHRWRAPDPGDVVTARWDPEQRDLRLDLGGDPRYDEKMIKALGRTRDAPTWPPSGFGDAG